MDTPVRATGNKRRILLWLTWILTLGLLAILASPCMLCMWVYFWPELTISTTFHLYPDAQQISYSYSFYGADSGLKAFYYWTPTGIDTVQNYYENFIGTPFIIDRQYQLPIHIYQPYGGEWTAMNVDGSPLERDFSVERRCHYTEKYDCINIRLIDVKANDIQALPYISVAPSPRSGDTTPFLTASLTSGTVIIYSYYVSDF